MFWATGQGLRVLPGHEELIALRMRAHHRAGDLSGVRLEWESYERVLDADPWSDGEPAQKLVVLRRQLLAARRRPEPATPAIRVPSFPAAGNEHARIGPWEPTHPDRGPWGGGRQTAFRASRAALGDRVPDRRERRGVGQVELGDVGDGHAGRERRGDGVDALRRARDRRRSGRRAAGRCPARPPCARSSGGRAGR